MSAPAAVEAAKAAFSAADRVVREQSGSGIIATAFDLATPALMKALPAASILVPLIRRTVLPMVEHMLTAQEHTELELALQQIEEAVAEITDMAQASRLRIEAMSDGELEEWLRSNNLIRDYDTRT